MTHDVVGRLLSDTRRYFEEYKPQMPLSRDRRSTPTHQNGSSALSDRGTSVSKQKCGDSHQQTNLGTC